MTETLKSASDLRVKHDAGIGYISNDTEWSGRPDSCGQACLHKASCRLVLIMEISSRPEIGHERGVKWWWPTLDEAILHLGKEYGLRWKRCGLCKP